MKFIRKWFLKRKISKKVKEAAQLKVQTGKRHYVLVIGGKIEIYSKQDIKTAIRKKKTDLRIQDIRKRAIYITK